MITFPPFTLLSPDEPAPDGMLPIRLLPAPVEFMVTGMTVFGQGWHESTRWYLGQVADLVKPGMRVLDFGAGTGILAIAAARMGAEVTACEIEPNAIKLCRENCALNGVQVDVVEKVVYVDAVLDEDGYEVTAKPDGTFDLIFANIGSASDEYAVRKVLADVLAPGGRLVLLEA